MKKQLSKSIELVIRLIESPDNEPGDVVTDKELKAILKDGLEKTDW